MSEKTEQQIMIECPRRRPRRRWTITLAVIFASSGLATTAAAGPLAPLRSAEQAVHTLPLDQRPNRLGHFYGNNVRRMQQRRLCINCGYHDRPLARFFYLP